MIRFSDANSHLDWSVKELIKVVEKELEVRESHAPIFAPRQQQQQHQPKQQKQQHGGGTATALFSSEENATECLFCHTKHKSEDCKEKSFEQKKDILLKSATCFKCLQSGHHSFQCKSRVRCKQCKGKHRSAICIAANSTMACDRETHALVRT